MQHKTRRFLRSIAVDEWQLLVVRVDRSVYARTSMLTGINIFATQCWEQWTAVHASSVTINVKNHSERWISGFRFTVENKLILSLWRVNGHFWSSWNMNHDCFVCKITLHNPNRNDQVVHSAVLTTQMVMGSSLGLNLHQCLLTHLQVCWLKTPSCHADLYTVSKYNTRGESEDHTGEKACKKITHPGFEIQGRRHKKSKTRDISGSTKILMYSIFFKKLIQHMQMVDLKRGAMIWNFIVWKVTLLGRTLWIEAYADLKY